MAMYAFQSGSQRCPLDDLVYAPGPERAVRRSALRVLRDACQLRQRFGLRHLVATAKPMVVVHTAHGARLVFPPQAAPVQRPDVLVGLRSIGAQRLERLVILE